MGREVRERIRQRARAKTGDIATCIHNAGGDFMGMKRVFQQPRTSSPSTRAPRFGIRPNIVGRSKWARIEALQALKTFLTRYAQARPAPTSWRTASACASPLRSSRTETIYAASGEPSARPRALVWVWDVDRLMELQARSGIWCEVALCSS